MNMPVRANPEAYQVGEKIRHAARIPGGGMAVVRIFLSLERMKRGESTLFRHSGKETERVWINDEATIKQGWTPCAPGRNGSEPRRMYSDTKRLYPVGRQPVFADFHRAFAAGKRHFHKFTAAAKRRLCTRCAAVSGLRGTT